MTVTISANVTDITKRGDNKAWEFASVLREASDGGIITDRPRTVTPVGGHLSVKLDPGLAIIRYAGNEWLVDIPEHDANLWTVIAMAVGFPPSATEAQLAAAIQGYLTIHPPEADGLSVTDDGLYQFTFEGEPVGEPFGPPTSVDGGSAASDAMPILDGGNANGGPTDPNPLARRIVHRRGTTAQWNTAGNPVLLPAELGYDSTTDRLFYGNGAAQKTARSPIALLSDLAGIGATWGQIAGSLADQEDLIEALNTRAAVGHTHALAAIPSVTATAAELNKLAGRSVTGTELDFVHGVTSGIQTQIDGKGIALPNPCATGSYGIPGVRLSGATSTVAMATGTMYYGTLLEVRKAITITEWSARASNVASAGNLRVGIWAADNFMQPAALIHDSGSVAVASGSSFNITVTGLTIVLQPGLYIVGLTPSIAMTLQVLLSAGDVIARPRVSNPMVNRFEAAFTYGALAANGPAWTVQQTSATSGWHNFLGFVWTVN